MGVLDEPEFTVLWVLVEFAVVADVLVEQDSAWLQEVVCVLQRWEMTFPWDSAYNTVQNSEVGASDVHWDGGISDLKELWKPEFATDLIAKLDVVWVVLKTNWGAAILLMKHATWTSKASSNINDLRFGVDFVVIGEIPC
jgi:hypothetical protein